MFSFKKCRMKQSFIVFGVSYKTRTLIREINKMEIKLRPYQLSDVDDFMEWACDDQVIRTSRLRYYTSREDALDYLKEVAIPHPWYRAICLEDRPIGFICVKPGSDNEICRGQISYALGSKYWNKGITTMAVKMVISRVFEEFPGMERLEGYVNVETKASQRVLEKAGFQKEGVLQKYIIVHGKTIDVIMYSFLKTDQIIN
ncbi:uncharacterized protein LOC115982813 isoform X2 [Quercus lobata]|uniref:uncharacterized protein LOC115982813 isoform X2 n=1 Tax=Quercus lobata TaxID=97700 RepID=UPI001247D774|nr:uncharacterized protein LOC115982813 isoform X2 [Quercus lobata]